MEAQLILSILRTSTRTLNNDRYDFCTSTVRNDSTASSLCHSSLSVPRQQLRRHYPRRQPSTHMRATSHLHFCSSLLLPRRRAHASFLDHDLVVRARPLWTVLHNRLSAVRPRGSSESTAPSLPNPTRRLGDHLVYLNSGDTSIDRSYTLPGELPIDPTRPSWYVATRTYTHAGDSPTSLKREITSYPGSSPRSLLDCPAGASSIQASHSSATHRSLLRRNCYLPASCRLLRQPSCRPVISHPRSSPMIEVSYRFAFLLFALQRLCSRVLRPAIGVCARETPISVLNDFQILRIMAAF